MNWVRVDCYEPSGDCVSSSCSPSRRRCPLHKPIRQANWSEVSRIMRLDPSQILKQNSHGWSSMTLCLYHLAPPEVISEMLSLLSGEEQRSLLSTPVPNGSRLCLHFAARYADDLEVIKLLTEAFPAALLSPSDDGIIPVDRAIYYRKDAGILRYLEDATKRQRNIQQLRQFNQKLRYTVLLCCERSCQNSLMNGEGGEDSKDDTKPLAAGLYDICKDREMTGIFWNMLSYVGEANIS